MNILRAFALAFLAISSQVLASTETLSTETLVGTWERASTNMQGLTYVQLTVNDDLSTVYLNIDPKAEYDLSSSPEEFEENGSIFTINYSIKGKLVGKLVLSGWVSEYSGHKMLFGYLYLYEGSESKLYNGIPVEFVPINSEPLAQKMERLKNAFNKAVKEDAAR